MGAMSDKSYQNRFSQVAGGYALYRPRYPRELIDYLAGVTTQHETVWDCACGSGQLSVPLAERFARVIATDASAEQLAQAEAHPRVEYRKATAEASGLPDMSVDLITVAQAAHWFDRARFYEEVRRVGRRGAVVALICYGVHSVDDAVDPIVRAFYGVSLAPYWGPERVHVEEGYRRFDFPFDEFAAPPMELSASWNLSQLIGYIETWSAVWAMVQDRGRSTLDDLREALSRTWGSAETVRTIRWPLRMRIGRVLNRNRSAPC